MPKISTIPLKRLAIIGLLVILAPASVCLLAGQAAPLSTPKQWIAKPGSGEDGPEQPNPQKSYTPPPAISASREPTAPACDEACQQGRENLAIQRKLEWFTGVLAAVGVLQGVLLFFTWRTIARQTEAAARSTAAFINKERSKLFIREEMTSKLGATFYAVNLGQSPARVTYGFADWECRSKVEELPPVPDYMRGDPEWCFKQDEWVLPKKETLISSASVDFLSDSVMSGKDKAWLYGVVRYSDTVSEEEHELRFCFNVCIRQDGSTYLFPGGPVAYRLEK